MKGKFAKLISSALALAMGFALFAGCGTTGDEGGKPSPENPTPETPVTPVTPTYGYGAYADLEKVSAFDGLVVADKWSTTVEKYTVIENGFLTLHPGTTQATLEDYNFESGSFEFQVKPNMKGDAISFVLCLQNDKYDDMNYASGMKNYTISIGNKGEIELLKYMGEEANSETHMKKLAVSEETSDTLAGGASFVPVKIDLQSNADNTQISFSIGRTIAGKLKYTQYIDYTDSESPYHGGRFAFGTMNGSGLAVADKDASSSSYVQPELPPFEPLEVKGVPVYEGAEPLSLFTGTDNAETTLTAFGDGWSGRNNIFNYEVSDKLHNGKYGIRLLPDINNEEGGTTEFVGHYNKYIFDQVQYDVTFAINKLDTGWLMFWFKLMSETQNVSAWGNKFTREASHCYMTYLDARGELYFNKWIDWQQFFLGDSVNIRRSVDPQDIDIVKTLRFYVEYAKLDQESEATYDSVVISVYLVDGDRETLLRQYQDSRDALPKPGFFGIQTFQGATMTIYDITATPLD